ncbi:MAG: SUMF1/EgtB/PvdO family nonheme iron enzyme, partial [Gemmatimonadota bacterium]
GENRSMSLPVTVRHPQGLFLPRTYVCYRASAPVTIDGNLEEKAWWDAPWTQAFEDHQAPNAPAPWRTTRAAMLWDDDNVYFAARLQEENVWGTITRRDAVIYLDNDFEIFLDVDGRGDHYYELEINALNTAWDMYHPKEYHRRSCLESAYDVPGLRHAVQVQGTLNYHHDTDTGWTVEVAWPWQGLAEHRPGRTLPPRRGQVMRVNFSRVQYEHDYSGPACAKQPGPCQDWIWNSTNTGDLHMPEAWGRVYFTDRVAGTEPDAGIEALASRPALARPPSPWQGAHGPGGGARPSGDGTAAAARSARTPGAGAGAAGGLHRGGEQAGETAGAPRAPRARGARGLQADRAPDTEDMVWIPPGTFTMGPDPSDPQRSPAHEVALPGYWIDRYPVTVARFAAFLNSGGQDEHYAPHMANPDECGVLREGDGRYRAVAGRQAHPAVYVGRPAAAAYAAWAGKLLPTEAQWERAARGPEGRTYPWGEAPPSPERANYDYLFGGTTEVGSFPAGATPEGIYDLAGNVKEWCRDEYHSYPGGAPMLDFSGMAELDEHQQASLQRELFCVRGGGWSKQEPNLASAYRDADGAGRWFFSLGCRCVREE